MIECTYRMTTVEGAEIWLCDCGETFGHTWGYDETYDTENPPRCPKCDCTEVRTKKENV